MAFHHGIYRSVIRAVVDLFNSSKRKETASTQPQQNNTFFLPPRIPNPGFFHFLFFGGTTRMAHRNQLAALPDDILLLIFAQAESARDLWALALSCRRLQHLISSDGWRIFVRNRFPSLSPPLPATGSHSWAQLADSMTWQSRSWEKRSLQFQALLPHSEDRRNGRPPRASRSAFMAVVDAHFDPATQQELVVWGAGEDIVARCRERQGRGRPSKTSWHKLGGQELGLIPGYDDVASIKVIEHGSRRAVIAGRHNGKLDLLSAEPDNFGEGLAQFAPVPESNTDLQPALEQDMISSLDILHHGGKKLLAAAGKSNLRIYNLAEEELDTAEITPATTYDLGGSILTTSAARLGAAKWMEHGETMALGLVGCKDGLRYLALTQTGWSPHLAAKSERLAAEFSIKYDRTICPNSLEAVQPHSGAQRGRSLLLSSWKDGTIRYANYASPLTTRRKYELAH